MDEQALMDIMKGVLIYFFIVLGIFALLWKTFELNETSVALVAGTLGGMGLMYYVLTKKFEELIKKEVVLK